MNSTELSLIQADYESYPASVEKIKAWNLDFPRVVSIETLVECNAGCSFCPYPGSPRKGQKMPNDLVYKIIEDLCGIPSSHTFSITLHRINEPLLDSRIREFSDQIAENIPSAVQMFWTNGTMLKEGAIEWITQYPHASLSVSLNSVNEGEHSRMMGFGLEKIFRGLDYLNSLVESGQFTLPVTLYAPFISEQQAREYGNFCRKRWPRFQPAVRPFFRWMGGPDVGMENRDATLLNGHAIQRAAGYACAQWFDLHILANGFTTKCCIDENGHVGNDAFDTRLRNVLDIYRESRILRERLPARAEMEDCRGCFHLG